ncbi:hypothetical protein FOE78_00500 [Microlunatus elymi]|uniref:Rhamnosyl transferase n=1 Tax=Microlunatus elymi TaxID=2596828 RepID=A0A516PTS9_9ACTN|nr:glycosyltransferase [Microlunatus elymi]QDP94594.1 hypothetical protein FOE78_00500 [Microlunatus elymi]
MTFIADQHVVDSAWSIDHVIITRFNLPSPGREQSIRSREGWLRRRVELFETYCEPSVVRQTSQDFHWLIYFDPDSPDWLKAWIERNDRRFTPFFRTSVPHDALIDDLRRLTGATGQILITTNLDNDDGLSPDFVARVQQSTSGTARRAIYLTRGVIMHGHKLYLYRDRLNAFCSVSESWEAPVTAWADWHNRLGRSMPVAQLTGAPGWLQVVHGGNVSNRVHGRRVALSKVAGLLPGTVPMPDDPGQIRCLAENLTLRPMRGVRTVVRSTIRRTLIRAFGRDGFDRLKNAVAEIPQRVGGSLPEASVGDGEQVR